MFKLFTLCLFALLACVAAKPHLIAAPVSYATPAFAAPAVLAPAASAYYPAYTAAAYSPFYGAAYATYPYATASYVLRR